MKIRDRVNQVCDFREKNKEKQDFFSPPLQIGPLDPIPDTALSYFESLFYIRPDWIPFSYSKKGLALWEGGATWIEKGSARIQLKSKKNPFLYSMEEILSHELVHAVRASFDSPQFEEILAFQTSVNPVRRFLGPLFSSPNESLLFVLSLMIAWTGYTVGWWQEWEECRLLSFLLPCLFFFFLFARLLYRQYLFRKAKSYLKATLSDETRVLHTLLFAQDSQIRKWATSYKKKKG